MSLNEKIKKIADSATAPMEKFALAATGINTLLASIAIGAIGPVGAVGFVILPAAIVLTGTVGIVLGSKLIGEKAPTLLDAAQNVTAFMASGLVIAGRGLKATASAFFGKPVASIDAAADNTNATEKTPCPSCVSKVQPANTAFNNPASPTTEPAAKAAPCTVQVNTPKI